MANNLKRILAMVLAVVMVVGMMPMNVFAAEGEAQATTISTADYSTLQDAINEAQRTGGTVTITLAKDVTENVTINEAVGLYLTIDGAGKTMNGSVTIKALSDTNDNRRTTIQNVKFVNTGDSGVDFITSTETNHYPRLSVLDCSFTGNGQGTDVAVRTKSAYDLIIKNCTGTGLHSFLQNTAGVKVTVRNVTVSDSRGGLAMGTAQNVEIRGCNISTDTYGIRLDAQLDTSVTLNGNTVNAYIPVSVRKATAAEYKLSIVGSGSSYTATNPDGVWMAICGTEYEEGVALNEAAGNVKITWNTDVLDESGVYGAYEWPVEVVYADGSVAGYDSLSSAMGVSNGKTKEKVVVYKDITEEIKNFDENIVCGDPDGSVTITNTYTGWTYIDEACTIGEGVTLKAEAIFITDVEMDVRGHVATENLYVADDATLSIYAPGSVFVDGSTHIRRNSDLDAGVYIYGDGDDSTVEYKSTYYTGHYSGTFYAEDANVEMGYVLLENTNDVSYGSVKMELNNSDLTVTGTDDGQNSFHINGEAALTLSNGASIEDVRDFNIETGAELTMSVDSTSSVSATNVNIADDVALGAEKNDDGSWDFAIVVKGLKGSGTEADPYLISNVHELLWFQAKVDEQASDGSTQFAGTYFKLTADIDLAGINWNPIGSMTGDHGSFKGVFDGDGHTISNLSVEQAGNGLGLFARTAGNAVIKNVNLVNVTVKSTDNSNYLGGLVGNAYASTKIQNVHVSGDILISGRGYIGGIAGHGYVVMDNVSVKGNEGSLVTSTFWCAGGILGYGGEGTTHISNAQVEGLTITSAAGGLGAIVGMAEDNNGTQPISGENLSAKNVEIKTYVGGYGTAYEDYAMGYLFGGNPTSELTGNLTVEDVVVETASGKPASVNDAVATVDGVIYFDLQAAVDAVADGGTITLLRDVTVSGQLINSWYEGIYYEGDKSFTVDLGGYKLTNNSSVTDYLILLKNSGSKANEITFKNGTIEATSTAYCAICTSSGSTQQITVNLEDVNVIGNNSNGSVIKVRGGTVLNVKDGTVITGTDSYLAIESYAATANIYDGAEIYMNGTTSYNGCLVGVGGNGTVNVYGGYGKGVKGGFIAMTSGGTINVSGGEWIANTDGTAASDNKAVLIAQSESGAQSTVNVTGGTLKGGYNCYGAAVGDAELVISGGSFNVDPTAYLAEDCEIGYVNGNFIVKAKIVATVNGDDYSSLQEAINAANGSTVYLKKNVVLQDTLVIPAGTVVTLDLKGYTISQTKAQTAGYQMILNDGNLTIADSVGGGKISYTDSGNGGNYISDTIYNRGVLVINGGTIENLSSETVASNGFPHAVDTYSGIRDTSVTINGGTIYCAEYSAVRMFCVSATNKADLTINGGTIKGAVDMQNGTTAAALGSLTVNGGTFETTKNSNNIRFANWNGGAATYGITAAIKGGSFNGGISTAYVPAAAEWNSKIISGGVFSETAKSGISETLLAPDFVFADEANADGYYGLVDNPYYIADLAELKEFRDAVNAGNTYKGKTVTLGADIDLANEEWTPIGTSTNPFNGTFDGNGKTISNLVVNGGTASDMGFFGRTNNGEIKNLTINNAKVSGRLNVGVVAGTPYTSKYTNIKVTGHVEVNGLAYVGGVAGKNAYADWTDVTVDVDSTSYVNANSVENGKAYRTYVGGVIGFNGEGGHTFKNISSNIKVIGSTQDIGGIFGIAHYGNKFENITFTGSVEAPADATEVGGIAGVWHNEKGQTVTFTDVTSTGTVTVGDVTTTGSIVGGAYHASNQSAANSGSLMIDGKEAWICVAKIGETRYAALADAVAEAEDGDEIVIVAAGTYAVPTGKNIAITGMVEGVVFDNIGAKNMGGASVTFDNVTFNYTNANYKGLQHCGDMVYNNCTINGQVFLYGASETFNNCTFNQTSSDAYNVWTYGAKEVVFNECTFNSAGKSVLIYSEDKNLFNDVTVTDCDFIASTAVEGKAAIEMDSSLTAGINLTIDGETTATGFGTGNVSGNSLWNNKKGNSTDANNDITVVVAGETVLAPVTFVAYIGTTGYTTIDAAIKAANAGDTVTILAGDYTTNLSVNKAITVIGETDAEGNNLVNISGKLNITADGATVKNINVNNGSSTAGYISAKDVLVEGCSVVGGNGFRYCYTSGTVTFKDSTITGSTYGIHFDGNAGGNIVIDNCVVTGWTSFAGTIEKVTMTDTEFAKGNYNYIRFYQEEVVIDGCTFNEEMAVDLAVDGATATVTNSTVENGSVEDLFSGADIFNSTITVDGVELVRVAKNGDNYYKTLAEAIDVATAGDTIVLLAHITEDVTVSKSLTIDGGNNKYTGNISVKGSTCAVTVKNVNFVDGTGYAITTNTIKSITVENCTVSNYGYGFLYANKSTPTVVVKDVTVEGGNYGIHWVYGTSMTLEKVTMTNVANGIMVQNYASKTITMKNCSISGDAPIFIWERDGKSGVQTFKFEGANTLTADAMTQSAYAKFVLPTADATLTAPKGLNVTTSIADHKVVYENGVYKVVPMVYVVQIGNVKYESIQEAVNAAEDGATITVIADHAMVWDGATFIDGSLASMVVVAGKSVTIDLNGKALTVAANQMNGTDLYAVFAADEGGSLKLTDSVGTGSVKATGTAFAQSSTTAYSMLMAYEDGTTLTIEGGSYYMETAHDNLIYAGGGNEIVTVNGGSFTLGNVGSGENGKPWIFNTLGQNERYVVVNGGTFNADVNHQFWAHEVYVPKTLALKNNGNGTWTVVDAVAYVNEENHDCLRNVGYATLEEAIAAASEGETVTLVKDLALTAPVTVKKSITIDGNGHKITQAAECNNDIALLYFDAAEVLDVTIKNVTFDGIKEGAAIRTLGANITIDNCVFQNCDHTTVGQGLLRLTQGSAVVKNSKFLNNNCPMVITFNWDTAGLSGDTFLVENCVFEGNTANSTALIYYVKGEGCEIKNNQFVNNKVNCEKNGAVVYLGFQENCTVTGNLFKNNVVTDSTASTRVAGAIFFGYEAKIVENAFIGNTASNASGDVLGQVCTSTYYDCDIDLSRNYWGGEAPVYGKDYTIQHQTGDADFGVYSYYAAYNEETNTVYNLEAIIYAAQIGKLSYTTLAEAIAAAKDGDTVVLLGDSSENVTVKQTADVSITIDGNGKDYSGTITIHGAARHNGAETLTIQNFNFVTDEAGHYFIDANSTASAERYAHNVTVKDSTFTATGDAVDSAAAMRIRQGFNITIDNVKTTDLHSLFQGYGCAGLTVNDVDVNGKNGISVGTSTNVNITNANIIATGYGVRADGTGAYDMTVKNSTITADQPIVVRKNTADGYALTVEGNKLTGSQYGVVFTSGDDGTYEAPTVGVKLNVEDSVSMFPAYTAKIGELYYADLATAMAAANVGDTITLLAPITIEEGEELTLTKRVTVEYSSAVAGDAMITNKGTLTVAGTNIVYTYTGAPDTSYGKGNYTINNYGTLNVKGGSVENATAAMAHASYAINTNAGATLNVSGGKVANVNGHAIRQVSFGTAANTVNISGGSVVGTRPIWVQLPSDANAAAPEMTLNISGGELVSNEATYNLAIYVYSYGQSAENVDVNITDGIFDGNVAVNGAAANTMAANAVTVSGGIFNGEYGVYTYSDAEDEATKIAITGGTFATNYSEFYAEDDGYVFVKNTDGTYGVEEKAITINLDAIEVSYDAEVQLRMKFFIDEAFMSDENATVVVTKNGRWGDVVTTYTTAELKEIGTDSKGRYVIAQGVASGEMTMPVTIEFIDGNGSVLNVVDYADGLSKNAVTRTVLDYVRLVLEKGNDRQKKIAIALVTYGGYAQKYFKADADNPAYNVLAEFGIEVPDISTITADTITDSKIVEGGDIGITQTTQTTFLDSAIYLRTYFVLDEGASIDDYTFTLTYTENKVEKTMAVEAGYEAEKGRYYVDILDIPAAYLDYMYKITVTNTATGETYSVTSSVNTWIKLLLEKSTNADQIAMGKAMYYYNQCANEFFGK